MCSSFQGKQQTKYHLQSFHWHRPAFILRHLKALFSIYVAPKHTKKALLVTSYPLAAIFTVNSNCTECIKATHSWKHLACMFDFFFPDQHIPKVISALCIYV